MVRTPGKEDWRQKWMYTSCPQRNQEEQWNECILTVFSVRFFIQKTAGWSHCLSLSGLLSLTVNCCFKIKIQESTYKHYTAKYWFLRNCSHCIFCVKYFLRNPCAVMTYCACCSIKPFISKLKLNTKFLMANQSISLRSLLKSFVMNHFFFRFSWKKY